MEPNEEFLIRLDERVKSSSILDRWLIRTQMESLPVSSNAEISVRISGNDVLSLEASVYEAEAEMLRIMDNTISGPAVLAGTVALSNLDIQQVFGDCSVVYVSEQILPAITCLCAYKDFHLGTKFGNHYVGSLSTGCPVFHSFGLIGNCLTCVPASPVGLYATGHVSPSIRDGEHAIFDFRISIIKKAKILEIQL